MSISCTQDSDCDFNQYCQLSKNVCEHVGLWPPSALDVITYILIPWVVGIGNVGGLGGGIAKVPLIMLLLDYSSKEATFISYCILFGSCLANSTILMFRKHPTKDRPLIDYTIVLILNPMVLLGTNIGIFLNILLPEIAAGSLFILFLLSICPYLFKKGRTLYAIRQKEIAQERKKSLGDQGQGSDDIDKDGNSQDDSLLEGNKEEERQRNKSRKSLFNSYFAPEESDDQIKKGDNDEEENDENENEDHENHEINNQEGHNSQNHNNINNTPDHTHQQSSIVNNNNPINSNNINHTNNNNNNNNAPHKRKYSNTLSIPSIIGKRESILHGTAEGVDQIENEEVQSFLKDEGKQVPMKKLLFLIVIFSSVQFLVFLRGGKGLSSFVGITTCSTWYWVVCFLIVAVAFVAFAVIRRVTSKWETNRQEIIKKHSLQTIFEQDLDLQEWKRYAKVAFSGLLAGTLAGTFGVGAGLALVPILLSFNVNPQVAAATCGFNYFFISLTTIIQVFTNDYLSLPQIGWFSFLSFLGGFVCAKYIYHLVTKYKANYAIVFIVFGLAILNIISFIIYLTKKGVQYGWGSLVKQTPFCSQ